MRSTNISEVRRDLLQQRRHKGGSVNENKNLENVQPGSQAKKEHQKGRTDQFLSNVLSNVKSLRKETKNYSLHLAK